MNKNYFKDKSINTLSKQQFYTILFFHSLNDKCENNRTHRELLGTLKIIIF